MRKFVFALCVCSSMALVGWPLNAGMASDRSVEDIGGFRVEYGQVGIKKFDRMRASLQRQMEIVERAQVPPAVLEFFKTVPVIIVADLARGFGRARTYAGRPIVELKAAEIPGNRPILLHELLHAYHGKLGRVPAIRDAYEQAKRENLYPKRFAAAHFLENPREYFAVIGSIYLYGRKIDQPPFDCDIPAKHQPQFIAFLAEHFGTRECK